MSTAIGSMLDLYKRKLIYGKEIPEDKMEQYFAQLQKLAFSQGQTPTDPYTPTVTVSTDMGAIHAILGILTESNELAERLTNNLFKSFYNGTGGFTEEDLINFQEETGDLFWYIALLHETLGLDNQEVLKGNIRKLEARYKGKFSAEAAINRDTEKEMVAMRRVK
jgi:NTP pyrophosphatase (non-canonical NTP hydrolase)